MPPIWVSTEYNGEEIWGSGETLLEAAADLQRSLRDAKVFEADDPVKDWVEANEPQPKPRGDGIGCTCHACCAGNCTCENADWTPKEVYRLQDLLDEWTRNLDGWTPQSAADALHGNGAEELRRENDRLKKELAECRGVDHLAGDPRKWGHAAVIEGLSAQMRKLEQDSRRLQEQLETARKLAKEAADQLVDVQPHIEPSCYPGRQGFIDVHIDMAYTALKKILDARDPFELDPVKYAAWATKVGAEPVDFGEAHQSELARAHARSCCRKHWEEDTGKHAVGKDGVLWNPIGMPFIMCTTCGNKRCPKATDCSLACTNSNEPGQAGSVYAPIPCQHTNISTEFGCDVCLDCGERWLGRKDRP